MMTFTEEILALKLFLKFVGFMAGGCLAVSIIVDLPEKHKKKMKKGAKKIMGIDIKKIDKIDFSTNEHVSVLGTSRWGKTFAVMHSVKNEKYPVLFFNTQEEKTPSEFMEWSFAENTLGQLEILISENKKVSLIPDKDWDTRQLQLDGLIKWLFNDTGETKIKVIVDESHLFKKKGKNALMSLATTGLRWNKEGIFLTQRPANLDNDLLNQSTRYILFGLGDQDYEYLERNGFPVISIKERTQEKYQFVEYDRRTVSRTMKVKV